VPLPEQPTIPDTPAPALDPAVLASLRALGGEGFLDEILTHFLQDIPPGLTALQQAATAGDALALMKAAHSLKSSAGNVGARRMAELCETLETQGRAGSVQGADSLIMQLAAEFERVRCAGDCEGTVAP
jgi:HPt (histidine-containing phosphotransfer) domain-containing protein